MCWPFFFVVGTAGICCALAQKTGVSVGRRPIMLFFIPQINIIVI